MAYRKTRQKLQHSQFLCLQPPSTKPRNPLSDCADIWGKTKRPYRIMIRDNKITLSTRTQNGTTVKYNYNSS